ncbi:STAS domain-containing protein [Melissospora conviva]|uniref:STAS domain-containing protein n=1 Tax=Melissospora conviva TaxID=3388432 RepID=UPI003C14EFAE
MTFTLSCTEQGGVAHLRLAGELDISSTPQLGEAISRLLGDGHHRLLVDLSDLTFCDSTGMSAFVRGDNEAAAAGGWLRLTGASGRVARLLRLSGLADVLGHRQDTHEPSG